MKLEITFICCGKHQSAIIDTSTLIPDGRIRHLTCEICHDLPVGIGIINE